VPVEISPTSPERAYVTVTLSGTVTTEEFDVAAPQARTLLTPWMRALYDASGLVNAAEVLAMLMKAPCGGRLPEGVRHAAVLPPGSPAIARTFVRVASPGSAGAQTFTAPAAAVAWLMQEYQTTTGGS
jgi:hypothetical protein